MKLSSKIKHLEFFVVFVIEKLNEIERLKAY